MAGPERVPHDVLPAARGDQFRGVGEAADDGHAGEAGGGGGGEGACGCCRGVVEGGADAKEEGG